MSLHWTMLLATHPFFVDTVAVVGRLLALQGSSERAHVLRRLTTRWGDRSTLARAVPRVLASLTEWGTLSLKEDHFRAAARKPVVLPAHAAILIEAVLLASPGHSLSYSELASSPMLSPFDMSAGLELAGRSSRLRLYREGLDVEIVSLEEF